MKKELKLNREQWDKRNRKLSIRYIKQLAVNSYEIDPNDIIELIEQLELECVIKLLKNYEK